MDVLNYAIMNDMVIIKDIERYLYKMMLRSNKIFYLTSTSS